MSKRKGKSDVKSTVEQHIDAGSKHEGSFGGAVPDGGTDAAAADTAKGQPADAPQIAGDETHAAGAPAKEAAETTGSGEGGQGGEPGADAAGTEGMSDGEDDHEASEAAADEKPADPAAVDEVSVVALETDAGDASAPDQAGETEDVTGAPVLDPAGNPANEDGVPSGEASADIGKILSDMEEDDWDPNPVITAAHCAAASLRYPERAMPDRDQWLKEYQAFCELAIFFRAFPDSPDEAGPVQLQRLGIETPEEVRPGHLMATIRVFRVALDQLDRLDREDAARAAALEPKPEPEAWREPKGYALTKEAMKPGSGLKPR